MDNGIDRFLRIKQQNFKFYFTELTQIWLASYEIKKQKGRF
jgi:hypothetical protein